MFPLCWGKGFWIYMHAIKTDWQVACDIPRVSVWGQLQCLYHLTYLGRNKTNEKLKNSKTDNISQVSKKKIIWFCWNSNSFNKIRWKTRGLPLLAFIINSVSVYLITVSVQARISYSKDGSVCLNHFTISNHLKVTRILSSASKLKFKGKSKRSTCYIYSLDKHSYWKVNWQIIA